jgi:antitoxin component YwqK of YwqJK toxin-antitoxin module
MSLNVIIFIDYILMNSEQNTDLQERKTYHHNGQLKILEYFQHGKPEGTWTAWHSNGQIRIKCVYRNGKLEGEYNSWYECGKCEKRLFYRDGEMNGNCRYWYRNGQLMVQAFYRNGVLQGEYWYKNWSLIHEFYRDDIVIDKRFTLKKKRLFIRFAKLFRRCEVSLDTFLISDLARSSA